jgi:uncharacterized protein (TIGR02001 family)
MKQTIKALTAAAAVGFAPFVASAQLEVLDDIEGSVSFGFESEYSFRGVKQAGQSIQPEVTLGLMGLYGSIWQSTDIKDGNVVETNYVAGYALDVEDLVNVDLGVTRYAYPTLSDTTEIYLGLTLLADEIINPALYGFYDFDTENFTLELQLGHGFDLGEGFGLDLGVDLGYVWVDEAGADDYFYYQASADIVYSLTETTSVSVGGRVAGNDANVKPDNQLWFGAALTTTF